MADVSTALRTARERAGLTLDDISARTKIKVGFLQAIERGEFERLPGEFFTRAFLRTYAREVHLAEEPVVQDYDAARRPVSPVELPPASPVAGPALRPLPARPPAQIAGPSPWTSAIRGGWPVVAVGLALIIAVTLLDRRDTPVSLESGAVGTAGLAHSPATPAPPAEALPTGLTIDIRPSAVIWVAATADGKRVIYRLLQPGERVTVKAGREVSFRVGNAGAFEYSLNGAPGKPVGASGEVAQFTITRDNYQTFRQ